MKIFFMWDFATIIFMMGAVLVFMRYFMMALDHFFGKFIGFLADKLWSSLDIDY